MNPFAFYAAIVPLSAVALDQGSKWWVTQLFGQPMDVCASNPAISERMDISPVLDFALYCNQGVSFGMMGGASEAKRWGLTLLALAVCAMLVWSLRDTTDRVSRWGLSFIIGGALGNAIDRAVYGAVTDFLDVTDVFPFFRYIFNVADSFITVGVILMLWGALRELKAAREVEAS